MAGKHTSVFGIYPTRARAEEAVDALRQANFRNTDISALFPDNAGTKDFAHEKNTKAPEGTVTGATSGAVVGGVLGWLAGIGALAIPGVGPLIAAGPIMGMLAGAGAVGAVGGVVGALVGMGIPEYEAKRYEGRVKNGGILLSVHCDSSDWIKRAEDILKRTGAEDVSSAGEASANVERSDKPIHHAETKFEDRKERAEEYVEGRAHPVTTETRREANDLNETADLDYTERPRTRTSGGGSYEV